MIRMLYRRAKLGESEFKGEHPDEEGLACFLEGRLSEEEAGRIKEHLLSCASCLEAVALHLGIEAEAKEEIPESLLRSVKDLVSADEKASLLEIILRWKEKTLELIHTTGDILVGQELVPAPVLRGRAIKDFPDRIIILKDFQDIRIEAKIESKPGLKAFSLTIMAKEKATQKIIQDLRVTLIKDNVEFESYVTDTGRVTFEHVLLGKYTVEISGMENKLASVILDINM